MIYVTGDMHGDITRFKDKAIKKLRRGDTLIVCGDFGFVWDHSAQEQKLLQWIGKRRFNTLFIDGTHDNLDLLAEYPLTQWQGGPVRVISGRLMQLQRGHIYNIEDSTVFAMGGGESHDAELRQQSKTWWHNEMPTPDELEQARENLEAYRGVVDYIVTHDCPGSLRSCVDSAETVSHLGAFFNNMQQQCRYKKWFFGAYHQDKQIPPYYYALYKDVVPVRTQR
mgnify:CR=1 FL=1